MDLVLALCPILSCSFQGLQVATQQWLCPELSHNQKEGSAKHVVLPSFLLLGQQERQQDTSAGQKGWDLPLLWPRQ